MANNDQAPQTYTVEFTLDELTNMTNALAFLHAVRPLPEPALSAARSAVEKVAAATGHPMTLDGLSDAVQEIRKILSTL